MEKKNYLITKEGYDLSVLNSMELKYFRMMYPKSGILMLFSEPGLAKSAIMKNIANKLKFLYIEIRLSQIDETDVGLFPDKWEGEVWIDGKLETKKFLDHITPRWAWLVNQKPTIIHFEELNRARLHVRNAALQIFQERGIGYDFSFNENVFMCASGNLGDEDGTDVEEFDSALNGRLLPVKHELKFEKWCEYYADEYVHSIIRRYITAHPDHYYISKKNRNERDKQYASPRSWTYLSDYIQENYGKEADINIWIKDIENNAYSYIGGVASSFLRYLRDTLKISILNIIDEYPKLKAEGVQFTRDKKSELIQDLKKVEIFKLEPNQLENTKLFLLDMKEDEIVSYLIHVYDVTYVDYIEDAKEDERVNKDVLAFLRERRFQKYIDKVFEHVKTKI